MQYMNTTKTSVAGNIDRVKEILNFSISARDYVIKFL